MSATEEPTSRAAAVVTVVVVTALALVVPLVGQMVLADLGEPVSGPRCVAPHHLELCERWEASR